MEAYKTTCPDCEHVRFWVGYKTGLGKTPEQLKMMQEEETTCVGCGSKRAKTGLDFESETGKEFSESANFLAQVIAEIIKGEDCGKQFGLRCADGRTGGILCD